MPKSAPQQRAGDRSWSSSPPKSHCTFHLMSSAFFEVHREELKGYKLGKGSIQFTPDKPLPAALVTKLVRARVAENEKKRAAE